MNADVLRFINPYLVATQVVASKREVDLNEILLYCKDPEKVPSCGRKNLYKVFTDLFSLYRTNAPRDIYSVTPEDLNVYAGAYAKYVLKKDIMMFDDVLGWNNVIKAMYESQDGKAYKLLRPLLELNAYKDFTLEIGVFICNILALALNDQQLILNPMTFNGIRQYVAQGDFASVDELVHTYVRYREFLDREWAFAHFLYTMTIQFGYLEPIGQDGAVMYTFPCGDYTLKGKYLSGTGDWGLTLYNKNKGMMGNVKYSDAIVRCSGTVNLSAELLAKIWYSAPDMFDRKITVDEDRFKELFKYTQIHGRRQALVVKHLRNTYKWTDGEYTLSAYNTPCGTMLNVRRSLRLIGVIECTQFGCFASNMEVTKVINEIHPIDVADDRTLEQVFIDYVESKFTGEPSVKNVVHEIVNVLNQYDVSGLETIRQNLPLAIKKGDK